MVLFIFIYPRITAVAFTFLTVLQKLYQLGTLKASIPYHHYQSLASNCTRICFESRPLQQRGLQLASAGNLPGLTRLGPSSASYTIQDFRRVF